MISFWDTESEQQIFDGWNLWHLKFIDICSNSGWYFKWQSNAVVRTRKFQGTVKSDGTVTVNAHSFDRYKQMDFQFAMWQMLYLFISPQKVYRNFSYRKREWAGHLLAGEAYINVTIKSHPRFNLVFVGQYFEPVIKASFSSPFILPLIWLFIEMRFPQSVLYLNEFVIDKWVKRKNWLCVSWHKWTYAFKSFVRK